ncbi:MAG: serine hydrolase domain-containing protein, partial [Steroidobacteraceae bacterium]
YGLADVERKVPATADTVYEIGSITKQFTSMAVLLLVERGRLGLADPIGKSLPGIPEAWRACTIRQLLSHTSGIPDYEEVMGYDEYRNPMAPDQVFAFVASRPLDFEPGTRWKYSNTGYYVLTLLIEKLGGESYTSFVTSNILTPAGMSHTRSSEPTEVIANRASGYVYREGFRNRDAIQPTATGGAGLLVSTVGDMVRWASFLSKRSLLKPESYAEMLADTHLRDGSTTGYGFGWFVAPMRNHPSLSHSGETPGFTANFLSLPDDRVTIVVLQNSGSANPFNVTDHLARVLVPALRYAAITDRRPEVAALVRDFYAHRTDPEPRVASLSATLAAQVTQYWPDNLNYYRELGTPAAVELVEQLTERSFHYRVRYR